MNADAFIEERPRKLTRAEKNERTRAALLEAAAQVVGETGYANASIAAITVEAGVAQGTFYNYFESREELFDRLLPYLGERMLDYIGERTRDLPDGGEREEAGLRAFFSFLDERTEFYRVLYEAETFAPSAFRAHTDNVARGFVRVLKRGAERKFTPRQLEAISFMLMGARHYLAMRYARGEEGSRRVPDWVIKTYMDMLRGGLGL